MAVLTWSSAETFWLGAVAGALVTRLQWSSFKRTVEDQIMRSLQSDTTSSLRREPPTTPKTTDFTRHYDEMSGDTSVWVTLQEKLLALAKLREEIRVLQTATSIMEDHAGLDEKVERDESARIDANIEIRYRSWISDGAGR